MIPRLSAGDPRPALCPTSTVYQQHYHCTVLILRLSPHSKVCVCGDGGGGGGEPGNKATVVQRKVYSGRCTVEPLVKDTPEIRTPLY